MVNGVLYLSNGVGLAEAIDPKTGAPVKGFGTGKQYVAFAIGGQQHPAELVALSLP